VIGKFEEQSKARLRLRHSYFEQQKAPAVTGAETLKGFLDMASVAEKPNASSINTKIVEGHCPRLFTSQRDAILSLLRQHRGQPVPVYKLAALSLQYNARLYELRAAGFVIENDTKRTGRQIHGTFTLVSEPGELPTQQTLNLGVTDAGQ
jgi:hypothetical protein